MSCFFRLAYVIVLSYLVININITEALAADRSEQPQRITELHYQITDSALSIDTLVADPALLHNFDILSPKQAILRTNEQQAIWLLLKIRNPYPESWHAVLSYHFLPADQVSFFKLANDLPTAELLGHTGSDLPFSERALPLTSFSQPILLARGEQATYLIRLQDAALLGTEVTVASLPQLLQANQRLLIYDSTLHGAILLLALLAFTRGVQQHQAALYALAGFYLGFLLVLATLNGIAFSLLWPFNPELNPVMLYISVGISLFFLTLFNRYSLPLHAGNFAFFVNTGCLFVAMLLLFSPLYANGPLKLKLLFSCVTLLLTITVLQAIYTSLTSSEQFSSRFSLLATAATLNLLFIQTRYLTNFVSWLNVGVLILVIASALLMFSIPKKADNISH